jgi:hypothetical protein
MKGSKYAQFRNLFAILQFCNFQASLNNKAMACFFTDSTGHSDSLFTLLRFQSFRVVAGLPDVFSYQKIPIWVYFGGPF